MFLIFQSGQNIVGEINDRVNENNIKLFDVKHPIKHGRIVDWDCMEELWSEAFKKLHRSAAGQRVFLTRSPIATLADSERMVDIMLEKFQCDGVFIASQGLMTMFTEDVSGIALCSGAGFSFALPVSDGKAVYNACQHVDIGGNELTRYLKEMLRMRGYKEFTNNTNAVNLIKENNCYVAKNFEEEMALAYTSGTCELTYNVENGDIVIDRERFRCPELLFYPVQGWPSPQLHQLVVDSIVACPPAIQTKLYGNIVVSGGNTLFPGAIERLETEIRAIAPASTVVKVIAGERRKISDWIGGSITSSLTQFEQYWISRKAYEEKGKSVVRSTLECW